MPKLAFSFLFLAACGNTTSQKTDTSSPPNPTGRCETTFYYETENAPDGVHLAGEFNDWDPDEYPMEAWGDGQWALTLGLDPGAYAYQFIEFTQWEHDGALLWSCDPEAALAICDDTTVHELDWSQSCEVGAHSCNSMIRVPDCQVPQVTIEDLSLQSDQISVRGSIQSAEDGEVDVRVTIDEMEVDVQVDGRMFTIESSLLTEGRHTINVQAVDANGAESSIVSIPLWNDDWMPEKAVIYHALIDRVANGNPGNDQSEGTSHAITDWTGGDIQGLHQSLPYLESLGINTIWISNPQKGPTGAWGGDCNATYSSYHGFWPSDWDSVDPHLGTLEDLDAFIEAAHDRGMRVWMDWVGNHVHSDHPLAEDSDQFNGLAICKDVDWEGVSNWDKIPETCWFTDYMPDWDHSQSMVMDTVVEMAIDWARERKLDGLRVDAAKHMSHAVVYNLRTRTEEALVPPGSPTLFPLIGETFDQAPMINAYIGDDQLHGQFDFPLYWTIRSAFVDDTTAVKDAVLQAAAMDLNYPGGLMSTFLGNLDVGRFLTAAHEGNGDVCPDGELRQAGAPEDGLAFDKLRLAWTLLFTQPGMPLVYYGDEFGLPGYGDPDNRQPLWWHGAELNNHDATSLQDALPSGPARVLETVRRLSLARSQHPALRGGTQSEWWDGGPGLYATAHTRDGDQAIVILNRTDAEQWLDNDLTFVGLNGQRWVDVLTDEEFTANDQRLVVSVPAFSPRVLVVADEESP